MAAKTDEKDKVDLEVVEETGNYRDAPQQVGVVSDPVLSKTQAEVGSEIPDEDQATEEAPGAFAGVDPGHDSAVDPEAPGAGTAALSTGPDGSDYNTGQPTDLEAKEKAAAKAEKSSSK